MKGRTRDGEGLSEAQVRVDLGFVIDRKGTITFALEPKFDTPTSYEKDIDLVLEALNKAAR